MCLLGYVFYRSFSKVSKIVGQATLGLGVVAVIIVAIVYARRRLSDSADRARLEAWMNRHRATRWIWHWFVRPVVRVAWPQIRFLWGRLTPGQLGLEFTTTMAVAVAGAYVFILYASIFDGDPMRHVAGDATAFRIAHDLRTHTGVEIAKLVSAAGSLPFVGTLVVVGSVVLALRRRPLELFALAGGFGLVVIATHVAKAAIDRPRPSGSLVDTLGSAYPSGHAAYATAYIAIAVIATRVLDGVVSRTALVLAGVLVAAAIGATRVYLRAHYLSDVLGGAGLGLAIFAGCAAIALVVAFIRQNAPAASPPH
jgi:undecaprenyl-diphosphatase